MSTSVRKLHPLKAQAAVDTLNAIRLDLMKAVSGSIFHADATTAVDVDNAVEDGYGTSSSELANALKTAYNAHIASACSASTGIGCHLVADSANAVSASDATDVASAVTLTTQFKSKFNSHIGSATYHMNADSTNTVANSNNNSEAALVVLVNEEKAAFNAHVAAAFSSQALLLVDP